MIVPDGEKVVQAYIRRDLELLRELGVGAEYPIEVVNKVFRENTHHRFAWDYEFLQHQLSDVGFREVRRAEFRDSADPALNLDLDDDTRIIQSLYVEARR